MSDTSLIARLVVPAAVILLATAGIAEARSSGGGRSGGGRSFGSHSSMGHSSGKIIGWGRGTCHSSACRSSHPTGSFSFPIFPKKRAQ